MCWIKCGVPCWRKHFNLVKVYGRLAVTICVLRDSSEGMCENEPTFPPWFVNPVPFSFQFLVNLGVLSDQMLGKW